MSPKANPVRVMDAPVPPSNESKVKGRTELAGTDPQLIIYAALTSTPCRSNPPRRSFPPKSDPSGSAAARSAASKLSITAPELVTLNPVVNVPVRLVSVLVPCETPSLNNSKVESLMDNLIDVEGTAFVDKSSPSWVNVPVLRS